MQLNKISEYLQDARKLLQSEVEDSMWYWRSWTFRNYRLSQATNSKSEY